MSIVLCLFEFCYGHVVFKLRHRVMDVIESSCNVSYRIIEIPSVLLKDKEIFNSTWCVICLLLTKNVNESTGCADGYQNNVTGN